MLQAVEQTFTTLPAHRSLRAAPPLQQLGSKVSTDGGEYRPPMVGGLDKDASAAPSSAGGVQALATFVALAGLSAGRRSARRAGRMRLRGSQSAHVVRRAGSTLEVVDLEVAEAANEAVQLQLEAAKLRADVAALEAAQEEQRKQQQQALFRSLDADKSGALDAHELQNGVKQVCGEAINDVKATRLLQALDKNGDGVLQPEEYDLRSIENMLAKFRVEERAAEEATRAVAREEKEREGAIREREEYLESLPPRNEDTSLPVRLASALAYLLPLIDVWRFGFTLFAQFPAIQPVFNLLLLPMSVLNSVPFGLGYLVIFISMQNWAANRELPALLRFNLRQAITLDISLFFPGLLGALCQGAAALAQMEIPADISGTCSSAVFVLLVASVLYSVACSLLGTPPEGIPVISKLSEEAISDTRPNESAADESQK
jgi:Ca2+-binding EF-hand superfamily protein